MILRGSFVFISESKRESNGKTYYSYNAEFDDGSIERLNGSPDLSGTMEKYHRYTGEFRIGSYNGSTYINLLRAEKSKI